MTLPNFLIIGAAKSGTTSLFNYLGQHPQIYTKKKEPGFFAYAGQKVNLAGPEDQERFEKRVVADRRQYEALFAGVTTEKAYGEASVAYLYVPGTAERIHQYVPEMRLIAILRNPVERAFSSYMHMRRDGREPLPTFAEALEAEAERIEANWDYIWHYTRLGFYYEQLRVYYSLFPADQIAVFLFEDFKRDPVQVIQSICRFLDVDDAFWPDTALKYNVSGEPRWPWLHDFVSRPHPVKTAVKPLLPLKWRKRMGTQASSWNLAKQKPALPGEIKQKLQTLYYEDILHLQTLIGKDLTSWLSDETG